MQDPSSKGIVCMKHVSFRSQSLNLVGKGSSFAGSFSKHKITNMPRDELGDQYVGGNRLRQLEVRDAYLFVPQSAKIHHGLRFKDPDAMISSAYSKKWKRRQPRRSIALSFVLLARNVILWHYLHKEEHSYMWSPILTIRPNHSGQPRCAGYG